MLPLTHLKIQMSGGAQSVSLDSAKWYQFVCFLKSEGAIEKFMAPNFVRYQYGGFQFTQNIGVFCRK